MSRSSTGRTLKTARAVLQVMRFMAETPRGVEPGEVARFLGKSHATASYLLNSLCQEGYANRSGSDGLYHLRSAPSDLALRTEPETADLPESPYLDAVGELYQETGQRSYLVTVENRALVVQEIRGRQGQPKVPGLGCVIREEAHAVAVGKVVLAHSPGESVAAYVEQFGLPAFTRHTVVSPEDVEAEGRAIRREGYAVDCEEFATGFTCVAAPLFDATGALRGALGLSTSAGRFGEQRSRLTNAVREIAQAASPLPYTEDLAAPVA
jgi:DNA-binding IclR family transcriptional regulator